MLRLVVVSNYVIAFAFLSFFVECLCVDHYVSPLTTFSFFFLSIEGLFDGHVVYPSASPILLITKRTIYVVQSYARLITLTIFFSLLLLLFICLVFTRFFLPVVGRSPSSSSYPLPPSSTLSSSVRNPWLIEVLDTACTANSLMLT